MSFGQEPASLIDIGHHMFKGNISNMPNENSTSTHLNNTSESDVF